jgi:NAD(P)-dependent dehydrogenase (short-subunit alcohol dehydrogenase family)
MARACDVADYAAVDAAIRAAQAAFGSVDILINNAGVIAPISALASVEPQEWSQMIDINLKGVFYGIRAALPIMQAQGAGTILTVSSGAAHHAVEGWSGYCASKAGAAMLTESLHLEHHKDGIRSMGLSPGTVATQMQKDIKASGINPVSQLDWSAHIATDWPAKALVWMCTSAADPYLGTELSLRDTAFRQKLGLL